MKQAFPLIFLVCCCVSLVAQPVLEWTPPPGVGYAADVLASDFIEPTPSGEAAQEWDFSGVAGSVLSSVVVAPAATSPFAALFDGAEWVNDQNGQLAFWTMGDGQFTVLGNANATVGITLSFDDPLVQWAFPLALGDELADDFGIEQMLFGLPHSLQGSASSLVDAWGSLTMPDGTVFPEVLRGRYEQQYTEIYEDDTANWSLVQHMYFVPDSTLAVFLHEDLVVTDNGDNVLLEVSDVAWYGNGVLTVGEEMEANVSEPYPNPVMAGAPVEWPLPDGWKWRALDADGRVLAQGVVEGDGKLTMSTADWAAGLVLLVAESADGRALRRVHRLVVH